MAEKKDLPRIIRLNESMDAFVVETAGKLDCSVSQLIRAAVLIGAPILLSMPALVDKIDLDDMHKSMS